MSGNTHVSGNTQADAIIAFVILGGIALPTLVLWLCSILSAPTPTGSPPKTASRSASSTSGTAWQSTPTTSATTSAHNPKGTSNEQQEVRTH